MAERKAPNPVDAHVGSRLRLRRLTLGFSQEKLGRELGLTFQQVQKYERGANRIGASRLYAIAKILEAPVSYFFEGLDELETINPEDSIEALLSTPEAVELNRSFARISDQATRRRLTELVRSVADSDQSSS